MCALNPKYKKRYIIDVYTSYDMTEDEFLKSSVILLLESEIELNEKYPRFRFHLKETEQEAE